MATMPETGGGSDQATRTLRITVLCGGPSAEREVSLESGRAIADALRRRGHEVFVADINPDDLSALDHAADVVFPALHGTFGEDGTLQRILEERGVAYVGSGPKASALAMDKVMTKRRVEALGLMTPPWEVVNVATVDEWKPRHPLPLVVKPVDQGSSVLTCIVREPAELRPAVRRVVDAFGRALVELYIAGDEITVGVLDELTLPPIVVRPKTGMYDYEAKYRRDDTEYLFDAGHSPELIERVQAVSWQVFDELGCRHLARIDWIVDAQEELWFLEANTLPGFTSHSLVPKAAAHLGIPFDELCERLALAACEGRA